MKEKKVDLVGRGLWLELPDVSSPTAGDIRSGVTFSSEVYTLVRCSLQKDTKDIFRLETKLLAV